MFIIYERVNCVYLMCIPAVDIMDRGFLLLYVVYMAAFLTLPVYILTEYDLPPISTLVVAIEQVST